MGVLKVWAPSARRMETEIRGSRIPMEMRENGWWQLDTPLAETGTDYAFCIDGGAPLPDPRSRWQPIGVHKASRLLDPTAFTWTDARWQPPPLASAVIYELHVGTFSAEGTFDGVAKHLDHLLGLGVTHIELMPVNGFSGQRGWGYDGVNLFSPHEAYGGPEGLMRLVNACHERGLAVILDVVYNHLGPEGNYLGKFGPYFTDRYASPWGQAINFDGAYSDDVRRFFCDNAIMWLCDYHIDALRLDAIHAIFDSSATHILEQLANEVDALEAEVGRHLTLIAESDLNDPRIVRAREIGGYGLDAQWSDDFHHSLHTLLTGEASGYYADFGRMTDLAKALTRAFVYDGQPSPYRRRVHGRPIGELSAHKFLGYIQNHDQVGNRARGDRLSQLVNLQRLKIAGALVMTSPFVPMLFMGEEWGASTPFQYFTSHEDKALGEAVREGRRKEFEAFGWDPEEIPDPQAESTFLNAKLKWDELKQEPHRSLLDWYRQLIALRKSYHEITDGTFDDREVQFSEEDKWLCWRRGRIRVEVNLAATPRRVTMDCYCPQLLLSSENDVHLADLVLVMPPESVAILKTA